MAETFEEQVAPLIPGGARDEWSFHAGVMAARIASAVRANPAPVLALLSDDALEAEMQRRKEAADG